MDQHGSQNGTISPESDLPNLRSRPSFLGQPSSELHPRQAGLGRLGWERRPGTFAADFGGLCRLFSDISRQASRPYSKALADQDKARSLEAGN